MRLVMIIILALVILGGGGAGAYFFLLKPAEASVGDTADHTEAKEAKSGHSETATFVELNPLILPIVDEKGVSQVVNLVVSLEVNDPVEAEKVKHLAPRLTDAYIRDMYGVLSKKSAMTDGVLQVGMLKDRLNKVSTEVVGEGVINDVLLQVVQQRPM